MQVTLWASKRYKKYKLITIIWYFLSLVSFGVFIGVINFASILADMICCAVIGFFLVGLVPISFNFSGEMAYPESEATSSALLQSCGDMLGVVIIEISKYLVQIELALISGKLFLLFGCNIHSLPFKDQWLPQYFWSAAFHLGLFWCFSFKKIWEDIIQAVFWWKWPRCRFPQREIITCNKSHFVK